MLNINDEINRRLLDICPPDTEIYLVGGYIRDVLLGRECFDRDYAVKGYSAIKFAKKVADLFNGYFVPLDKEHDIARVVLPDKINTLDFAGCVGPNIYTDLENRDYTINAMACKLEETGCELIDPLSGRKDLEAKLIKVIAEKNLIDDPLRLLRAFRLAAQFSFVIEEKTLELITAHHKLINNVAVERVSTELIKLLESENAAQNLTLMKNTGILFEILPELLPQTTVPPNLHHHLWLIDHSLETVTQMEKHIKRFPIPPDKIALLKIAALLHDIGKPVTWSIDEEGRHRFIKHEDVGSDMVLEVLKRLRFSKKDAKHVSLLVKNHLYPSQLIREGLNVVSEKALMRFFRRINDAVPELLLLAMSDRKSAQGPDITREIVENNVTGIFKLLEKYKESQEEVRTLPKLASGEDVMELLNIPKGPQIGKVLSALKEAQFSGDVNTREDAVEFIKGFALS
ncbi:MAG: hypothetical protein A2Y25_05145 [Candidatus Melainabacteria bacterium GWF2_37_15]|nr:MAG: hypothetical protein A2Y25_05145 [Candidatus Melainabacteria bacterium GWF2_37_15]